MEESNSWESNIRSGKQNVLHLYETPWFVRACCQILSWAAWLQSTPFIAFLQGMFNIIYPSTPRSPKWSLFPSDFWPKSFMHCSSQPICCTSPPTSPWRDEDYVYKVRRFSSNFMRGLRGCGVKMWSAKHNVYIHTSIQKNVSHTHTHTHIYIYTLNTPIVCIYIYIHLTHPLYYMYVVTYVVQRHCYR
jgi:hypothetical protein